MTDYEVWMIQRFFAGNVLAVILFVFFGNLGVLLGWITRHWGGAK